MDIRIYGFDGENDNGLTLATFSRSLSHLRYGDSLLQGKNGAGFASAHWCVN
jgi:hypothetical protein